VAGRVMKAKSSAKAEWRMSEAERARLQVARARTGWPSWARSSSARDSYLALAMTLRAVVLAGLSLLYLVLAPVAQKGGHLGGQPAGTRRLRPRSCARAA
jgi:hypothetical protein